MRSRPRFDAALRRQFREALGTLWPVFKGSFTHVAKPCVRPDCVACLQTQQEIEAVTRAPAQHSALQNLPNLLREQPDRGR